MTKSLFNTLIIELEWIYLTVLWGFPSFLKSDEKNDLSRGQKLDVVGDMNFSNYVKKSRGLVYSAQNFLRPFPLVLQSFHDVVKLPSFFKVQNSMHPHESRGCV